MGGETNKRTEMDSSKNRQENKTDEDVAEKRREKGEMKVHKDERETDENGCKS